MEDQSPYCCHLQPGCPLAFRMCPHGRFWSPKFCLDSGSAIPTSLMNLFSEVTTQNFNPVGQLTSPVSLSPCAWVCPAPSQPSAPLLSSSIHRAHGEQTYCYPQARHCYPPSSVTVTILSHSTFILGHLLMWKLFLLPSPWSWGQNSACASSFPHCPRATPNRAVPTRSRSVLCPPSSSFLGSPL